MTQSFRYISFPQEIIFGAGALEKIGEIIARNSWSCALLITTRSQRANGHVAQLENLLGEKLFAIFDTAQPHVPQANVDATMQIAREKNADVLIALGGGSALGVAQATAHWLSILHAPPSTPLPTLALPTTYAGSEMTPVFGVTRERDGIARKETTNDPRTVARVVIYDPLLTLDVPRELTGSTGMNALAHCVEAVYSITRNPISTALALHASRLIFHALPRCVEHGNDVAARTEMLQGAYLAGTALANVAMALHHGVCHVLGGTLNVPHGIANAIVLPHAVRFNADACAKELAELGRAIGIENAADETMARALAERVADLVTRMELPTRLREVGVKENDLPMLAQLAFQNKTVQNNPKKILNVETMEIFLREMY